MNESQTSKVAAPAQRLQEALSDPLPTEQAGEFHARVMERLKDLNNSLRRSATRLLLIAAIIQLLDLTAISDFQLGPVQFSDLTLIRKFLPVIACYLIYDIVVAAVRYAYARGVAAEFDRIYRPKLAIGPYIGLTYPPAGSILGPIPKYERQTVVLRCIGSFAIFLKIAAFMIPFILVVYSYMRLFSTFGYKDLALYLSAAMSICLSGYAILLAWAGDG